MRWLIGICVVAACAGCGSGARVLFEIHGDVGPVARLEVIVAEPLALEKLQRTNEPIAQNAGPERVYYVAQRTATEIDIGGGSLDGFELQVAAGDEAPYLPILIAHDAGGRIVGIGAYSPPRLFPPITDFDPPKLWATDSVQYRADVTVYAVVMQKVTQIDARDVPTPVGTGEVMDVSCDGAMSGLVWRVDEGNASDRNRELRILLPLGGELDARARLEHGADMDCDSHTATARIEEGDKLDCDDTTPTTFATAEELCNGIDDDCDGKPGAVIETVDDPDCAGACSSVSACADVAPSPKPVCAAACLACGVPQEPDLSAGAERACRSEAQLAPPGCGAGCVVTLVDADPRWTVAIGPRGNAQNGIQQPFFVQNPDDFAVEVDSGQQWAPTETSGGVFLLFVQPPGLPGYLVSFDLDISVTGAGLTQCDGGTKSMNCQ